MISEPLRAAAKASGLTQVQLAELAGMSQPGIRKFLLGGTIKLENADGLAEGLGCKFHVPKRLRDDPK